MSCSPAALPSVASAQEGFAGIKIKGLHDLHDNSFAVRTISINLQQFISE